MTQKPQPIEGQMHDVSEALNVLLADVFALYLKTKNFHWHMSGPHFRDYHLLLDDHADQIFAFKGSHQVFNLRRAGRQRLNNLYRRLPTGSLHQFVESGWIDGECHSFHRSFKSMSSHAHAGRLYR